MARNPKAVEEGVKALDRECVDCYRRNEKKNAAQIEKTLAVANDPERHNAIYENAKRLAASETAAAPAPQMVEAPGITTWLFTICVIVIVLSFILGK